MPEEKDKRKVFLDKFTEEAIMALRGRVDEKEKERRERERIKQEIEIQKLKEKFSKETIEKIKPGAPPVITAPIMPVQPNIKQALPVAGPRPVIKPAQRTIPPLKPEIKRPSVPPIAKVEIPRNLPPVISGEIDFGKIIFLVQDRLITYIECPGPGKNIIIRKAGNTFTTQVNITKEEILSIIKSFSEKTRIPLVEGMLTARSENIEISAIVSETLLPSFIIKKDIIPSLQRPPTQLLPPTQPYSGQMPMRPQIPSSRPTIMLQTKPDQQKQESLFKRKIKFGK